MVTMASPTVEPTPPGKPTLAGMTPPTPTPTAAPPSAPTDGAAPTPTPRPDTPPTGNDAAAVVITQPQTGRQEVALTFDAGEGAGHKCDRPEDHRFGRQESGDEAALNRFRGELARLGVKADQPGRFTGVIP